jgi:hypothetical protein
MNVPEKCEKEVPNHDVYPFVKMIDRREERLRRRNEYQH